MSDHAHSKTSPIAAIILMLVIIALVVYGIGMMNDAAYGPAAVAGALLFLLGLVMVLKVGKP